MTEASGQLTNAWSGRAQRAAHAAPLARTKEDLHVKLTYWLAVLILALVAVAWDQATKGETTMADHAQAEAEVKNTVDLEVLKERFREKDVLSHLTERFLQEQGWYWSRFAGFASLHAGAFVLVTSDVVPNKGWFAFAGFVLGGLWWFIQWLSLGYVKRAKKDYYMYRDKYLGFDRLLYRDSTPSRSYAQMTDPTRSSSTIAGVVTAAVVWLIWLFYLGAVLI